MILKTFFDYLEANGKTEKHSWDELAKIYGIGSGEKARRLWRTHKGKNEEVATEELSTFIDKENGSAKSTFNSTSSALSDEEIYKECKMDPEKWVLTQVWQKSRQTGFNYSANFKLISNNDPRKIEQAFVSVLEKYKTKHEPVNLRSIIKNPAYTKPTCCLVALTDVHLDKQTIDGQTIESKVEKYHEVLDTLIHKAYVCNLIDEIVFTVGHDLFNTDTFYSTTTNGTQQYNNTQWDQSYEIVFDSQVKAINKLKQFCNKLYVKHIPSNHGRTKEYFLVHALEVYFKSDPNIIFDRSAESAKVHVYGENFIGMHHGDVKPDKLPAYFSQKFYKEWGMAKYKNIFIGDKHSRKTWNTQSTEVEGIRIYQTPHMGGYGQWDKSMMFENGIQSGICTIFDRDKGRIMEIEEII